MGWIWGVGFMQWVFLLSNGLNSACYSSTQSWFHNALNQNRMFTYYIIVYKEKKAHIYIEALLLRRLIAIDVLVAFNV